MPEPYIDVLVADAGAFLHDCRLHEMARRVVTVPEVLSEIRDHATRDRLQVLPYQLQMQQPDERHVQQVLQFARRTGDMRFLSATDVRVLALTRQLTSELLGDEHIRLVPAESRPSVQFYHPAQTAIGTLPVGFVSAAMSRLNVADDETAGRRRPADPEEHRDEAPSPAGDCRGSTIGTDGAVEGTSAVTGPAERSGAEEGASGSEGDEEPHGDDDDGSDVDDEVGWITPQNLAESKAQMLDQAGEKHEPLKVACLTVDFSMQNVLHQMGLEMVSVQGRRIREARRFIQRCFGCSQTTPQVDAVFCPACGNKTLKRVAVTLRPDGTQQIHISTRKAISKRGTKFSLPKHRGGKHAVNPILCADQPRPQQRVSKRAMARNLVVTGDYVTGASPFAAKDVTSRSAQLGHGNRSQSHQWQRRNPNQALPSTGNRKH